MAWTTIPPGATGGREQVEARRGKVHNDDRADWAAAWALFPGSIAYVWHGALHATTVAESLVAQGFTIRAQIIWAKERLVIGRGDYHWQHEPCWYAVRTKGNWTGDRKQTTLWTIPSGGQDTETVHGTQKPVECMRRPMLNNTSPGQAVYDPFLGSGTTLIAAQTVKRVASRWSSTPRTSMSPYAAGRPSLGLCDNVLSEWSTSSIKSRQIAVPASPAINHRLLTAVGAHEGQTKSGAGSQPVPGPEDDRTDTQEPNTLEKNLECPPELPPSSPLKNSSRHGESLLIQFSITNWRRLGCGAHF